MNGPGLSTLYFGNVAEVLRVLEDAGISRESFLALKEPAVALDISRALHLAERRANVLSQLQGLEIDYSRTQPEWLNHFETSPQELQDSKACVWNSPLARDLVREGKCRISFELVDLTSPKGYVTIPIVEAELLKRELHPATIEDCWALSQLKGWIADAGHPIPRFSLAGSFLAATKADREMLYSLCVTMGFNRQMHLASLGSKEFAIGFVQRAMQDLMLPRGWPILAVKSIEKI